MTIFIIPPPAGWVYTAAGVLVPEGTTVVAAGAGGAGAAGGTAAAGTGAGLVTAAAAAGILVIVAQLISIAKAVETVHDKKKLAKAQIKLLDEILNAAAQIRAARESGAITRAQAAQQVAAIEKAQSKVLQAINAATNRLQDALNDNVMLRIWDWFDEEVLGNETARPLRTYHGSVTDNQVAYLPLVVPDSIRIGELAETFASLVDQPDDILARVSLSALVVATNIEDASEAFEFFYNQWEQTDPPTAYSQLSLRAAQYFSKSASAPLSLWQKVYDQAGSDPNARALAIRSQYQAEDDESWMMANNATNDKDALVRVFAYEMLGSMVQNSKHRRTDFLELATQALVATDPASRFGATCGFGFLDGTNETRALLETSIQKESDPYIVAAKWRVLADHSTDEQLAFTMATWRC